jgi:serine/threonine-protein kinase
MKRMSARPGEVLGGKYRVERIMAEGGMGLVVAAHHLQLDQRVAIKLMLPAALHSKEAVARFQREARAAARLRSEHVARVLDVGTLEGGLPYMVMEYLEGLTLAQMLSFERCIPVPRAVEYVLQACEALAEAHALGIVHRDLKPSNMFVTQRPDGSPLVKLLDFGISKVPEADNKRWTDQHHVMGSMFYMSPEQIMNPQDVDARADIWSLGVILFELVTGGPPFIGATGPETCVKILYVPSPSLRASAPTLPAEFAAAVDRCLAKNREERFANLAELAAVLVAHADPASPAAPDRFADILNPTKTTSPTQDEDRTKASIKTKLGLGGD